MIDSVHDRYQSFGCFGFRVRINFEDTFAACFYQKTIYPIDPVWEKFDPENLQSTLRMVRVEKSTLMCCTCSRMHKSGSLESLFMKYLLISVYYSTYIHYNVGLGHIRCHRINFPGGEYQNLIFDQPYLSIMIGSQDVDPRP